MRHQSLRALNHGPPRKVVPLPPRLSLPAQPKESVLQPPHTPLHLSNPSGNRLRSTGRKALHDQGI